MVDWSGGNDRGAAPKADAIWIATSRPGEAPLYCRNRGQAEAWLLARIEETLARGRRLLIGFDFPFGYPSGFAAAITGRPDPLALWSWLADRIEDAPGANNRFDVAAMMNRRLPGLGPFWGNALKRDIPDLPRRGNARSFRWHRPRRAAEDRAPGAFEVWQLAGAGAVGSQALMGLPVLWRLRAAFPGRIAAWPFDPLDLPVAFVEIWPSLVSSAIAARYPHEPIRDRAQVAALAAAVPALSPATLSAMLAVEAPEEGWIFGLGHEEALSRAVAP
ncbi:molybdopterin guanine dinucleotide synthesis [Histidinibacterium lentulum]|uniref:Molybdopterin guanine dinucleotide synthesis n=2 Tax=Histidinibacterium lentulum TaxID=2480588 RepID=A0A3N2R5Q8_9RHOB|nr:molybdopterin guanine dinucleotide synthesis [Histidinibacterium lentulum]